MSVVLSQLAPSVEVAAHPFVIAVRRLATDLLSRQADRVDAEGLPAAHLGALAKTGVFGMAASPEFGGSEVPAPVVREVGEILAGACGNTWLVFSQHAGPLGALAASSNQTLRERWLPALCSGQAIAGEATGDYGPPDGMRATPVGEGWLLDGQVHCYIGWGLNHVLLIAAETDDDRIVLVLLPAARQYGLTATPQRSLAAMRGAPSVGLIFDHLLVRPDDVVEVLTVSEWQQREQAVDSIVDPGIFGLLRKILVSLYRHAEEYDLAEAAALTKVLAEHASELRDSAYRLADTAGEISLYEERLSLRAQAVTLLNRASASYLAACGLRGLMIHHPAQRWAREALFHLVRGQTLASRRAFLMAYADGVTN